MNPRILNSSGPFCFYTLEIVLVNVHYLPKETLLKMADIKFNLTQESSLTMWDEQVSAFWDDSKTYKAIYKGDDELMPVFRDGMQVMNQYLHYELKTPIEVKGDFEIAITLDTRKIERIQLCTIGDAGHIVYQPGQTVIDFGSGEPVIIKYPVRTHSGGFFELRIGRKDQKYLVYMASTNTGETYEAEFPSIDNENFDITSIFGGMMAISGIVTGVETHDIWTRTIDHTQEQLEDDVADDPTNEATVDAEVVVTIGDEDQNEDVMDYVDQGQEEPVEEEPVEETPEETPEEETVEEETTYNPTQMTPFDKLLDAEKALLADYKGLHKALELTKLKGRFTPETLEKLVMGNESYLLKIIYYALTGIVDYKGKDHSFLYQRAKYLAPMFGKAIEEDGPEKELEYGFKDDKEYMSFEFGTISNANLTNKMIVKLLMEEPEIWKPLLVKL